MPFPFHFLKCSVFEFVRKMGRFHLISPAVSKVLHIVMVARRWYQVSYLYCVPFVLRKERILNKGNLCQCYDFVCESKLLVIKSC